jgi:hypothetical protein
MKTRYIWVIRSKVRQPWILYDQYVYSAKQKSVKNRYHVTGFFYQARFFVSKDEAYEYFYKKVRASIDMSRFKVMRKKIWIGKDGYMDYWKNTYSFR